MSAETWQYLGHETVEDLVNGNSLIQHWEGLASEESDWRSSKLRSSWTNIKRSNEHHKADITGAITDGWIKCSVTYGSTDPDDPSSPPDTTSPDYGHIAGPTWTRSTNKVQTTPEDSPTGKELNDAYPYWTAQLVSAAQEYRQKMDAYLAAQLEDPNQTEVVAPTYPADANDERLAPPTGASADLKSKAYQFFGMLIRHPDISYEWDQPVLRKVDLVASYAKLSAVSTNTGRFYTTGALIVAEPSLDGVGLIGLAGLSDLYWKKQSPEVEEVSGGIYQIVQEYWGYVAFETILYQAAIT